MAETDALNDMGIFPTSDSGITQCVVYLSNLSFSDVLDTCKNSKFPGSLAVSISRSMIPRLQGYNSHHVGYEAAHILTWFNPVQRTIPTMNLNDFQFVRSKSSKTSSIISVRNRVIDAVQLDFGSVNGCFDIQPVLCVNASDLDFGEKNGLFLI
jgi:hypothetical protein